MRALVDASGAAAGAVCLFDTQGAVLRLAVEVGLSDEGCHVLRAMRADASGWNAPLVCHLEQTPSILEDTPEQPIPPLMEAAGPISTVACVPLNAGGLEVGTAILVSSPPHFLTAERLTELAEKLGEVEQAVHKLHQEVAELARRGRTATSRLDAAAEAAFGWIDVSTRATERLLLAMRYRSWIVTMVERLVGNGARDAERLRRLEAKTQALWRHLRLLEISQREHQATDTALRARLYDAEARLARERQRGQVIESSRKHIAGELVAVLAREREVRKDLERARRQTGASGEGFVDGRPEICTTAPPVNGLAACVPALSVDRPAAKMATAPESEAGGSGPQAGQTCTGVIATAAFSGCEPAPDHAEHWNMSPSGVHVRRAEAEVTAGCVRAAGVPETSGASTLCTATTGIDGRPPDCTVVVIDDDPVWAEEEVPNMEILVIRPRSGMAAHLDVTEPTYIVANLTTPGVLAALAELRAAGCKTQFWGCLAARRTAEAAIVGQVEPGSSPLDVDAVLAWLDNVALRGTRIMIAGANVNAFISLREALARAGMSVSVAWDVKQAVDLLEMVHPQIAILDLELPPRGAHRLVAQIAGMDPQPVMMLLPSRGDATAFSRVLRDNTGEVPCLTRGLCLANIEANLYWMAQKNGSARQDGDGCAGTRVDVTDPVSALAEASAGGGARGADGPA